MKNFLNVIRSWGKSFSYTVASVGARFAPERHDEEGASALVLMYHAVDTSGWRLSIPPQEFERQMAYLRRKHITVPLADVVALASGEKRVPPRAVAVTFDDGYADLVPTVLPILQRYRIPMTLFLNTDLTAQTNSLGLPRVSATDIETLSQSGYVTIASHAQTHRRLPELSEEELKSELTESKRAVEHIPNSLPYFAYPFGARSPGVEEGVKEAGYTAAFGISEGFIRPGDDLFRLKRVQVDASMSFGLFKQRLTRALELHRSIVDRFRRI